MPLLEIKNLVKRFPIKAGFLGKNRGHVHALQGVDLQIEEGKTLGLVGESGCGKSTLAKVILRLLEADEGELFFQGEDLLKMSSRQLRDKRKNLQIIFQDPYSSLNPRMKIGASLAESWIIQGLGNREKREERVAELLKMVGLSPEAAYKYPHEFSGGQRQRIGIARALSLLPKLIVCDEPVSALDVSIQSQILNLLMELKQKFSLTYLFISHDLKVVQHISDEIAVMYLGRIVEKIPSKDLGQCRHPYTQALLEALPKLPMKQLHSGGEGETSRVSRKKGQPEAGPSLAEATRAPVIAEVPSPINPPSGCAFHPRCPFAEEICKEKIPVLGDADIGHPVACHLADKIPRVKF